MNSIGPWYNEQYKDDWDKEWSTHGEKKTWMKDEVQLKAKRLN